MMWRPARDRERIPIHGTGALMTIGIAVRKEHSRWSHHAIQVIILPWSIEVHITMLVKPTLRYPLISIVLALAVRGVQCLHCNTTPCAIQLQKLP